MFLAVRAGEGPASPLSLPRVSPALAETFSVIGFPHLPRVCFLLTFNMFNRSLVILPKIIKLVPSIKMIHTQHIVFLSWLWFVKFFLIIFSVKSCGRNRKVFFTVIKATIELESMTCALGECYLPRPPWDSVATSVSSSSCCEGSGGFQLNLTLHPQKEQKRVRGTYFRYVGKATHF